MRTITSVLDSWPPRSSAPQASRARYPHVRIEPRTPRAKPHARRGPEPDPRTCRASDSTGTRPPRAAPRGPAEQRDPRGKRARGIGKDCPDELLRIVDPAQRREVGVLTVRGNPPCDKQGPVGGIQNVVGSIAARGGSARSASVTRAITAPQSPALCWRKRRALGYHGLSSRSNDHRQSAADARRIHTGLPRAPAMCATEVSTVITRSMHAIAAAVSPKSVNCSGKVDHSNFAVASASSVLFCRLNHLDVGHRQHRLKRGRTAPRGTGRM